MRTKNRRRVRIEWPTVAVALIVHATWLSITLAQDALPFWLLLPLGAFTVAWHSSLQHEIIHGHPTGHRTLDSAIGFLPLSLWLPLEIYRKSHLAHHHDERLTDPLDDPESYYVTREQWGRLPAWHKRLLTMRNSFVGRMTIGTVETIATFLVEQARELVADRPGVRRAWALHAAGLAPVMFWLIVVAEMPLWIYVLTFAWPGTALIMVRSFIEHQARDRVHERTAIVEAGPLMSLLFLNNNLHLVHHAKPRMPWYDLPHAYREERKRWLDLNGGYVFAGGYREVISRYLFREKELPVHPRR